MHRRPWLAWVGALAVVAALGLAAFAAVDALSPPAPNDGVVLRRPGPLQALAEHLPDGTPVWVVAHEDGTVSVRSGFDTHVPYGVAKLTAWCPDGRVFEEPRHGGLWDERGALLHGPSPAGLSGWATSVVGSGVLVGPARDAPPAPEAMLDTADLRCVAHGRAVTHTFAGWELWTSPTAAVASGEEGWILLAGRLVADPNGSVRLCAVDGCDDAVTPDGVGPVEEPGLLSDHEDFFIARVRDGRLTGVTRLAGPPQQAP